MTCADIFLLPGSGLVAGAINARAGGGTIFTFSMLIAVRLAAVTANATSAVSVLQGQIASMSAYRTEIAAAFRRLLPFSIVSAIGGIACGLLVLNTDETAFKPLVSYLILFATILFMLAPRTAAFGERLAEKRASDST